MEPATSIILTTACGYTPAQLAPFVESWRKHCPTTDLAVFAGDLPEASNRYLNEAGAIIVPTTFNRPSLVGWRKLSYRIQLRGWLGLLHALRRLLHTGPAAALLAAHVSEASFHLFSQRYFHYRRFLEHFGWKYSNVLLADIRDTIFQASPFPCAGLHVFAENELIGTSHFARRWFQLSYGASTFRELADKPMLCAGVTLGATSALLEYLRLTCAESLRLATVNDVDQAVHNVLVHRRMVDATIHPYGEGPAINLNAVCLDTLVVRQGQLVDTHGAPFAIVHQYDRVPGLALGRGREPSRPAR